MGSALDTGIFAGTPSKILKMLIIPLAYKQRFRYSFCVRACFHFLFTVICSVRSVRGYSQDFFVRCCVLWWLVDK